jgi:hypothetical protein
LLIKLLRSQIFTGLLFAWRARPSVAIRKLAATRYVNKWLFIHAALISAVFIRLPPALLVAPRNFAPRIFVSLHCFLLRRPPA